MWGWPSLSFLSTVHLICSLGQLVIGFVIQVALLNQPVILVDVFALINIIVILDSVLPIYRNFPWLELGSKAS